LRVICPEVKLAAKELGDETLLRRRYEDFARDFIGDGWFRLSRKLQEQIDIVAVNSRTPIRIAHDSTRLAKASLKVAKDSQNSQFSDKTFTGRIAKRVAKDSHRVAKDSQKKGVQRQRHI
jgi:hypothetical protein